MVTRRRPIDCPIARPEPPSHCRFPSQETIRGPVLSAGLRVRRQNASSAVDSSDFTGADVSGGAVLAASIGSRPPRDLFVAELRCLSSKFPLEIWALPPQPGISAAGSQGSQGEPFGTQGLVCCHAPREVSHLPCDSHCSRRQCRVRGRCVSCLTAASKVGRLPTTWSSCLPNIHSSCSINSWFASQRLVCFVSFFRFPGEFLHRLTT